MRDEATVGRIGEALFNALCVRASGAVASKPSYDVNGWDFLVEFPVDDGETGPLDFSPVPIECRIQVKSTDKKRNGENITLKNLQRLAIMPTPVFFVFFVLNGKQNPEQVYLVHFDSALIRKSLERIAKQSIVNKKLLHKKTMKIRYSNKHLIAYDDGEMFRRKINEYISMGMNQYIEDKKRLIATCGHENGSHIFSFSTIGEDSINDMVDASIGIKTDVKVDNVKAVRTRFGIQSPKPVFEFDDARLSFGLKPQEVQLLFRQNEGAPEIALKAMLYHSQLVEVLPDELKKIRIKSNFFEMVLTVKDNTINFDACDFNDVNTSLIEYEKFFQIGSVFLVSDMPFEMVVKISDSSQMIVNMTPNKIQPFPFMSDFLDVFSEAISICRKLLIDPGNVILKAKDINYQYGQLKWLRDRLENPGKHRMATIDPGCDAKILPQINMAALQHVTFYLGENFIDFWVAYTGKPRKMRKQESYSFTPNNIILGPVAITNEPEKIDDTKENERLDQFVNKIQKLKYEIFQLKPSYLPKYDTPILQD